MKETYARLWRRFVAEEKVQPGGHTRESWRRGRDHFAAFVIRVVDGSLFRRVDRIRVALQHYPFVSTHPDHFLHVTLLPVGFVVDQPVASDEISFADLDRIATAGESVVAEIQPFDVELASVNSFSVAPFIEIHSGSATLLDLHQRLARAVERTVIFPDTDPGGDGHENEFVPHVSLAYYTKEASNTQLVETIKWFRGRPIGRIAIRSIHLATIDTSQAYPPIVTVRDFPLVSPQGSAG
jgi:RNA 2',3'-cyclic 3'-phosphodiesterase